MNTRKVNERMMNGIKKKGRGRTDRGWEKKRKDELRKRKYRGRMNGGKVKKRKDDCEKGCKAVGKESVKRNTV